MELRKLTILVLIFIILITSVMAQTGPLALQAAKKNLILTEWDKNVGNINTESKFKDALLTLWETDAVNPSVSVDQINQKINGIYTSLGISRSQGLGSTWLWIVGIIIIIAGAYFIIKKNSGLNKAMSEGNNIIKKLMLRIRKNKSDILNLYKKINDLFEEAKKNLEVARWLEAQVKDEKIAELKSDKATNKKYQDAIKEHTRRLSSWISSMNIISATTIEIANYGKIELNKLKEIEIKDEDVFKRHYNPDLFSNEIRDKIKIVENAVLKVKRVLGDEEKKLLILVNTVGKLKLGLENFKDACLESMIEYVKKENEEMRILLKALQKTDLPVIKNSVEKIVAIASSIYNGLKSEYVLYNELQNSEDSILKDLDELELIRAERTKLTREIGANSIQALAREVINAKDDRQLELMGELYKGMGSERKVRLTLREALIVAGISEGESKKIAKEIMDRYKKLKLKMEA